MRLTDIMSHLDLAVYPTAALVLFAGVFVLVLGRVWRTGREEHEAWARIPLDATNDQETTP